MATLPPPRANALPGRDVRPFPARSASYRALSIIDAYGVDSSLAPPLDTHTEEYGVLPRSAPGLQSRQDSLKGSYESNFDIDEAYGSGEADLIEDDMEDVINLDEYDPYRATPPPPRTSSRKPVTVKVDVYEVKPKLPPKSKARKNVEYDPFKALPPVNAPFAKPTVPELASRSESMLALFDQPAQSPAVPPKDAPKVQVNGSLLAASKSTTTLGTPRSANVDKGLPSVPSMQSVRRKLLASPDVKTAKRDEQPVEQVQTAKKSSAKSSENATGKKDSRKDSMIQSDKGESQSLRAASLRVRSQTRG